MAKDDRDLLDVLKFELRFLQKGGYGRLPRVPWRPPLVFEDSPTCLNFNAREDREPCSNCLLMQFVPEEKRSANIPCRHIAFNAAGQTLDSLYDWSTQQEIEEALESWLKTTIQRLERERARAGSTEMNDHATAIQMR
jgi:hypothetical protein